MRLARQPVLAELDLREGRYAEARALAEEMKWIFKAKGIHRVILSDGKHPLSSLEVRE